MHADDDKGRTSLTLPFMSCCHDTTHSSAGQHLRCDVCMLLYVRVLLPWNPDCSLHSGSNGLATSGAPVADLGRREGRLTHSGVSVTAAGNQEIYDSSESSATSCPAAGTLLSGGRTGRLQILDFLHSCATEAVHCLQPNHLSCLRIQVPSLLSSLLSA